jgi:hypothetical protein
MNYMIIKHNQLLLNYLMKNINIILKFILIYNKKPYHHNY